MPGFTHLQTAQPITLGHHLLAYCSMFERDRVRIIGAALEAAWQADYEYICLCVLCISLICRRSRIALKYSALPRPANAL